MALMWLVYGTWLDASFLWSCVGERLFDAAGIACLV